MSFLELQQQFVAHIRNPKLPRPADVPQKRMQVYNELFFNNVQGFVNSAFPVLRTLYQPDNWTSLVRHFFSGYSCTSPYFLDIAEHFLHFLQHSYQPVSTDPVFLTELAHYEWAELHLATKILSKPEQSVNAEQLQTQALQLSELSLVLAYPYQVHQISRQYQPEKPGELCCYLLYRDAEDDVKFSLINTVTAALLHALQQSPGITIDSLIATLAEQVPQYSHQQLRQGASSILQDFAAKGAVVSFQAEQNSLP